MSTEGAVQRWAGWDPRHRGSAPGLAELTSASGSTPGRAFVLLALAGRGFRPPGLLSVHDVPPDRPASLAGDPAAEADDGELRLAWCVEYRQLVETAPPAEVPFAIYLLGVDPPPDATTEDLKVFNDFYTNVHLVEVAQRRSALRAVRLERDRVLREPAKGAPRFLAVYEVDEAASTRRRHEGPPYSRGPEVWQRHTTPWRLWYRTLG